MFIKILRELKTLKYRKNVFHPEMHFHLPVCYAKSPHFNASLHMLTYTRTAVSVYVSRVHIHAFEKLFILNCNNI